MQDIVNKSTKLKAFGHMARLITSLRLCKEVTVKSQSRVLLILWKDKHTTSYKLLKKGLEVYTIDEGITRKCPLQS